MKIRRPHGFLLVLLVAVLGTQCFAQSPGGSAGDYGKPGPEWLREAGMFNGWYTVWTDDMLERVKGFPLIVTTTQTSGYRSETPRPRRAGGVLREFLCALQRAGHRT